MAKWRKFDGARLNMYEIDEKFVFANSDLLSLGLICTMAYIYSLLRYDIYPYRHALATFLA